MKIYKIIFAEFNQYVEEKNMTGFCTGEVQGGTYIRYVDALCNFEKEKDYLINIRSRNHEYEVLKDFKNEFLIKIDIGRRVDYLHYKIVEFNSEG